MMKLLKKHQRTPFVYFWYANPILTYSEATKLFKILKDIPL